MRQRLDARTHVRCAWLGIEAPAWRAFQLAFLLLNLAGLVDGDHPERRMVDLLFFPTGGGKTFVEKPFAPLADDLPPRVEPRGNLIVLRRISASQP